MMPVLHFVSPTCPDEYDGRLQTRLPPLQVPKTKRITISLFSFATGLNQPQYRTSSHLERDWQHPTTLKKQSQLCYIYPATARGLRKAVVYIASRQMTDEQSFTFTPPFANASSCQADSVRFDWSKSRFRSKNNGPFENDCSLRFVPICDSFPASLKLNSQTSGNIHCRIIIYVICS